MRFVKQPQVRFTRDMAQIDGADQGYLMVLVRSRSGLRIRLRIDLKKIFRIQYLRNYPCDLLGLWRKLKRDVRAVFRMIFKLIRITDRATDRL